MTLPTRWILISLVFAAQGLDAQPEILREFTSFNVGALHRIKDDLYFNVGAELWRTDGTKNNTQKVLDLTDPYSTTFRVFRDTLFFQDYQLGDLYKIDPSSKSMDLVFHKASKLTSDNSFLYFIGQGPSEEQIIYRSDGTVTQQLPVDLGQLYSFKYPSIDWIIPFQEKLLVMIATSWQVYELWITDFTPAGTQKISDDGPEGFKFPQLDYNRAILGSQFFFVARNDLYGTEIWVTDGTAAGTHIFVDLIPGPASAYPSSLVATKDEFYFTTDTDTKLWVSQGTQATTRVIKEADGLYPINRLRANGDTLYLTIDNTEQGTEPWVTDGTPEGTKIVSDIWSGVGSSMSTFSNFFNTQDSEYILADDGVTGVELWCHHKTTGEFGQVVDFTAGPGSTYIEQLNQLPEHLVFFVERYGQQWALVSVDRSAIALTPPEPQPEQIPATYWTQFIGTNNYSFSPRRAYNYDMAVSPDDDIVLSGVTDGDQIFFYQNDIVKNAPTELKYVERNFISKFNASGELQWYKQLNGTIAFYRKHNAVDFSPEGSIYFATSMYPQTEKGELDLPDEAQGYLLKLDADGNQQWAKPILSNQKLQVSRLKVNEDESVYLCGMYFGFAMFYEGELQQSERSPSYFVAKIKPDGSPEWLITLPDSWESYNDIADLEIDPENQRVYVLISQGGRNVESSCEYQTWSLRVVCLNYDGEIVWENSATSNDLMVASSLAVSPTHDIFVTGHYRGVLKAGNFSLESPHGTGCHSDEPFLLKMNKSGSTWGLAPLTLGADPFEIQFLKDGTYLLSGNESTAEEEEEWKEGFPRPYPSNAFHIFLKRYDFLGNLLQEKTFNRDTPFDLGDYNPIARLTHNEDVVLSDRTHNKFDTITYSPGYGIPSLLLMKTSISAFPKGYTQEEIAGKIQLFPNPADDRLNLKIWRETFQDQNFEVAIFNLSGQVVFKQSLNPEEDVFVLDTYAYAQGMYIVKLRNREQTFVTKVVITH